MAPKLDIQSKTIIATMESKFEELNSQIESLKAEFSLLINSKNEEISALNEQVDFLKARVIKLENSIDDEDAYVRRDTVIFSGSSVPEVKNGEICSNLIHDLVRDKLKINLNHNDISVAHRIGKKPINQGTDKRGIMVKLCRRETKNELISANRNLKSSNANSTLYINESLTPKRRSILFALRQMKRQHPTIIAGCSTYDGRVYAYTKPAPVQSTSPASSTSTAHSSSTRNVRHLVNCHASLTEFCRKYIKLPLDNFLDSWNF